MIEARLMSIGEVARVAGLAPSTLRYYEQLDLLRPQSRRSGQRRYDAEALRRLAFIQVAKQAGFSLEEIKTLVQGFPEAISPGERWQILARVKRLEMEALIAKVQEMKRVLEVGLQCACASLERCDLLALASPAVSSQTK